MKPYSVGEPRCSPHSYRRQFRSGSIRALQTAPIPSPTNGAPAVDIVTPRDGSMFLAPADIHICAMTTYFTDAVANVEFFAGTNSLGVVTNSPIGLGGREACREPGSYYCLTWTNVPPGAYALTATAKDLGGNMVTSAVVDISVVTNFPPHVVITKPSNGAVILGPTNINICATAFDPDNGTVTQVEFFEDTNSLGVVTNIPTHLHHQQVRRVSDQEHELLPDVDQRANPVLTCSPLWPPTTTGP